LKKNSAVVGLVDEDPGSAEPVTLSRFVVISRLHDVMLKVDKINNNRLIVLCPRLEAWLIKTAKAVELRMEEFGLSEDLQVLDSMINARLPNIERLLKKLLEVQSPRLLHLNLLLAGGNE
jgi:hypothetical protein